MMSFRPMAFPRWLEAGDLIRVEEYREDGTPVVGADLPGIDPLLLEYSIEWLAGLSAAGVATSPPPASTANGSTEDPSWAA